MIRYLLFFYANLGILFEYTWTLYFLLTSYKAVTNPITPDPITAHLFSFTLVFFSNKLTILTADPYDQDTPDPPWP